MIVFSKKYTHAILIFSFQENTKFRNQYGSYTFFLLFIPIYHIFQLNIRRMSSNLPGINTHITLYYIIIWHRVEHWFDFLLFDIDKITYIYNERVSFF